MQGGTAVTVSRDWLDLLGIWSTVIAAVLALGAINVALIAIHRGNVIARNSDAALVEDRRKVFELGVIQKLLETGALSPPGAPRLAAGLLAMLKPDDVCTRCTRRGPAGFRSH